MAEVPGRNGAARSSPEERVTAVLPPGRLASNVMHFARALRAAGLPVGPGRVIEALRAIEAVGVGRRDDLYWTLHAVFVNRRDQRELFDQAFHIFWRNPRLLERLMQLVLPQLEAEHAPPPPQAISRRLADALADAKPERPEPEGEAEEVELDAVMTASAKEIFQAKDFEQMSAEEVEAAKRAIRAMRLPLMRVKTRRFAPDADGPRIDMRRTLRRSLRGGGAGIDIARRRRVERTPPLVMLCDVSGSMSRYSRMFLHFLHALTSDRERVSSFVFGTRLTNITRQLRQRDVDVALERVGKAVLDWEGGTRIGSALHDFNRLWSRRVLGQGAVVLLITDGLDREAGHGLEAEMRRLHTSCRRLIWLNPLLRFEAYAPLAAGARAMRPHVDVFRSVHNLESLGELAAVLSAPGERRAEAATPRAA